MIYMTTSDGKFAFDFTYQTPDDELMNRLSLQVLESRGPGEWSRVDCVGPDVLMFALRESGLLKLRRVGDERAR